MRAERSIPRSRAGGRARALGFGLLEALIAVVLLSFAALGYARLQMRSMASVSNSMWQTKALALATSMGDRLRANPAGWRDGQYDGLRLAAAPAAPSCGSSLASPCTSAQTAALDAAAWYADASQALPRPVLAVCVDATPLDGSSTDAACDGAGQVHAVKVFWLERGEEQRVVLQLRR